MGKSSKDGVEAERDLSGRTVTVWCLGRCAWRLGWSGGERKLVKATQRFFVECPSGQCY